MKDSKTLLLNYLASVRDPERAASLFADDGVFELPFLRSLGVEPRYTGHREISALVQKLLEIYPNFTYRTNEEKKLSAMAYRVMFNQEEKEKNTAKAMATEQ